MLQKSFNAYPAQIGLYAVKVKSGDDWKVHNACRLHISVGQAYHEGEKFNATTAWAKDRFKRVIVCVNDTLQLTNKMFEDNLDRPEAYVAALNAGDEWTERNVKALAGCEVVRWDQWKGNNYAALYRDIVNLEKTEAAIGQCLKDTAQGLWNRREGSHPAYASGNKTRFFRLSREYLLEEIAVVCKMIEQDRAIDIYPGSMLPVFDLMKNREIYGAPPALSHRDFARIDFSKRHANG